MSQRGEPGGLNTAVAQVTPAGEWLWTLAEAAEATHFAVGTIRGFVRRGKLHVYKPGGSDMRTTRSAVNDLIANRDCGCDECTAKRAAWEANGHG